MPESIRGATYEHKTGWRSWRRILPVAAALTIAAACGDGDETPVILTFDDLGGGSSIIRVYPGPGGSEAEMQYNGTFNGGDTEPVECIETEGRQVTSVPSVGEEEVTSDIWFRLDMPGETYYATDVYASVDADLSEIDSC